MTVEIKHRHTGAVLFSGEFGSLRFAVEAAVASGVDLSGADLKGADLSDADLRGAKLRGADLSGANLSGTQLGHRDTPFYTDASARTAIEHAAKYAGRALGRSWYVVEWEREDIEPAIDHLELHGLVEVDTDDTGWLVQFVEPRS